LSGIHDQIEPLRKRWEKWYSGVDVLGGLHHEYRLEKVAV